MNILKEIMIKCQIFESLIAFLGQAKFLNSSLLISWIYLFIIIFVKIRAIYTIADTVETSALGFFCVYVGAIWLRDDDLWSSGDERLKDTYILYIVFLGSRLMFEATIIFLDYYIGLAASYVTRPLDMRITIYIL